MPNWHSECAMARMLPKDMEAERAVLHCCLIGAVPRNLKQDDFGDEWNQWLFGRMRLLKNRHDWLQRLLSAKHRKESALRGERNLPAAIARVMYWADGTPRHCTRYGQMPKYVARLKEVARVRKNVLLAESRLRRAWQEAEEVA